MARLKNRNGYTMVELVVTFALLALFMVGMAYVITASTSIYSETNDKATAQMVSETLMEKVAGEISGAQGGVKAEYTLIISDGSVGTGGLYMDFAKDRCIAFSNRTGSQVYITTFEDSSHDYLIMHYRPVNDTGRKYKAVDWTFDKKFYEGYWIKDLTFQIVNNGSGKVTNVICVNLTISNGKTDYTAQKYVECYNFSATDIAANKIKYEPIPIDKNEE